MLNKMLSSLNLTNKLSLSSLNLTNKLYKYNVLHSKLTLHYSCYLKQLLKSFDILLFGEYGVCTKRDKNLNVLRKYSILLVKEYD